MPPSRRPRRRESEAAASRGRETRRTWARSAAIALGAAAILWLTLANTVGGVVPATQAGRVLVWSPFDARLKARSALASFSRVRDRAGLIPVGALAEQALRRDPTNVDAVRTLALVRYLQNRPREAASLFRYSDRLSRRDLGTRLWLIEDRVRADDVVGALRHFDLALRTSPQAAEILMPVLVSAVQEPHIARGVRALLNADPPWRQAFFEPLVHTSRSRATAVYLMAGRLNAGNTADRFLAKAAFSRFLRENDPAQAWALYDSIRGVSPAARAAAIRDGGFDQAGDLPPFDWMLTADSDLAGLRQGRPDAANNVALFIFSEGQRAGDVARQLLRLPPGRYVFRARSGSLPRSAPAQPSVRLECAGGSALFTRTFRALGSGLAFAVPAGCAAQWLVIAGGAIEADQPMPWVDDIAIARAE
jgi:hypothetical protein